MKLKVYRIKNLTTKRFLHPTFDGYEQARSYLRKRLRKSPLYMPIVYDTYRNPRHSALGYTIVGV